MIKVVIIKRIKSNINFLRNIVDMYKCFIGLFDSGPGVQIGFKLFKTLILTKDPSKGYPQP